MAIRVEPGDRKNPLTCPALKARYGDGISTPADFIRASGHANRAKQAGYTTAPDQIAIASKILLATQGPSIHDRLRGDSGLLARRRTRAYLPAEYRRERARIPNPEYLLVEEG